MMLWKCCTQYASKFGKLSSGHRTGKGVFIPITKKGKAKECSKYCTIALISCASLVAWRIKHLPTMQETRVRSLGREGPLEKEMAAHSSTLAWRISWTQDPGGLQSMGSQRVRHNWGNGKECSNYFTIALISHARKVMLKILQARLQQYMNCELPDVQAGFRKGRGIRDKLPTSVGS